MFHVEHLEIKMTEGRLGRGLKNLLALNSPTGSAAGTIEVDMDLIRPGRLQPRRRFQDKELQELTSSIREHGLLQPIVLRKTADDKFEIISGERRWRAAKELGYVKIPAMVRESDSDREMLELAIIENVQRVDLDPIEKGLGYKRLCEEFRLTQDQVAQRVGQDRSTVANFIRLTELPSGIQESVSRGTISMGHARALLSVPTQEIQERVFRKIVEGELSVRQAEALIRESNSLLKVGKRAQRPMSGNQPAWLTDLQGEITRKLSAKVEIRRKSSGGGDITISFASDEELERISKSLRS